MQKSNTIILVKVIALIMASTALYVLLPNYWKHWFYFINSMRFGHNPLEGSPWWILPLMIIADLILIFKLVAAYGLFRLKHWSRLLAVVVLALDFLTRLAGAINVWTYHLRHPEPPPIPEGAVVKVVNMWPSYIIGMIGLVSLSLLLTKSAKQILKEAGTI